MKGLKNFRYLNDQNLKPDNWQSLLLAEPSCSCRALRIWKIAVVAVLQPKISIIKQVPYPFQLRARRIKNDDICDWDTRNRKTDGSPYDRPSRVWTPRSEYLFRDLGLTLPSAFHVHIDKRTTAFIVGIYRRAKDSKTVNRCRYIVVWTDCLLRVRCSRFA